VGLKNKIMIALLIGVSLALILLSWAWANGIHNMNEKHPDYLGEDFLDWGLDEEDKNDIL
jgi:hypothetical protein